VEKELEKPVNTQKFEKQTSGSLKNKLQEVSKTNFKEFEKQTSRSLENKLHSFPIDLLICLCRTYCIQHQLYQLFYSSSSIALTKDLIFDIIMN